MSHQNSFLNGGNANYIDEMYVQWQHDPSSVHASWNAYFSGANYEEPPTLGKSGTQGQLDEIITLLKSGGGAISGGISGVGADRAAKEAVQLAALLDSFETVGHLFADLDPLRMQTVYKDIESFTEHSQIPHPRLPRYVLVHPRQIWYRKYR